MNRDKIDTLISYLIAIEEYAKNIHYNCSGDNFYGNHLFADRISTSMQEFIDKLKEVCLAGHGFRVESSKIYLQKAVYLIPSGANFKELRNLMIKCLSEIENIEDMSKGDENLIGGIAEDIQNNVGLINIMYGDINNV